MWADENVLSYTPMVKAFRERLLEDPSRPGYHFTIPEALAQPGDPNGAFFASGRYHLMYLYRHEERGFCWGHMSSTDLLHWRHHPDALVPSSDCKGCYSGGAFVDHDGKAYLSFWDFVPSEDDYGAMRIAVSQGPPYEQWTVLPGFVTKNDVAVGATSIIDSDGRKTPISAADPSNIWKKDDLYYLQAGNLGVLGNYGRGEDAPPEFRGDWTDLYVSQDMENWRYLHRFYRRNTENLWTDESEDDMCPSFLPLPLSRTGGEMSGKYLQLFISHNRGCQYYIGEYDREKDLFLPEHHGRMTWVDNTYFAPEALIDGQGRQIMWAWLGDDPENTEKTGWSGVYGLPRTLWYDAAEHTLGIAPVPELKNLRLNPTHFLPGTLENEIFELKGVEGLSCEIDIEAVLSAGTRAGIRVRMSDDGEEYTDILYDADNSELLMDTRKGTTEGRPILEVAPLRLREGELLHLSVFIDKSVVEVYANDRQAICRRVYPQKCGTRLALLCDGVSRFGSVRVWEMAPSCPY